MIKGQDQEQYDYIDYNEQLTNRTNYCRTIDYDGEGGG